LPYIREQGVTEAQIATVLVETPRRYFEHNAAGRNETALG